MNRLNLDVINEIISYLCPVDALTVSLTCKTLYELAIPVILRDVTLEVRSRAHLNRFIIFLLEDVTRRPRLIRRLELRGERSPYRLYRPRQHRRNDEPLNEVGLVVVLSQACSLRSLVLDWSEDLFSNWPLSRVALAGLTSLTSVQLDDFGQAAIQTLCSLRSSPADITLSYGDTSNFRGALLLNSPTKWTTRQFDTTQLLSNQSLLPNVNDLTWCHSKVSLDLLASAFPNVRTLELHDNRYDHRQGWWGHLDHFIGSLYDVADAISAANRPIDVRRITIKEDVLVDTGNWGMLVGIMNACTPSVMWFPIDSKNNLVVPRDFVNAGCSLRCLKVILPEYDAMSAHAFFLRLRSNMGDLPLTAFCICLERSNGKHPEIQDFDSSLPMHLAEAMPSASYIGLDARSDEGVLHLWWRVVERDHERYTEMIPPCFSSAVADILFAASPKLDVKKQTDTYLATRCKEFQ